MNGSWHYCLNGCHDRGCHHIGAGYIPARDRSQAAPRKTGSKLDPVSFIALIIALGLHGAPFFRCGLAIETDPNHIQSNSIAR
jgi:hypothetical protein